MQIKWIKYNAWVSLNSEKYLQRGLAGKIKFRYRESNKACQHERIRKIRCLFLYILYKNFPNI